MIIITTFILLTTLSISRTLAVPTTGHCAQLFPAHGVIYQQDILFVPGGVQSIPLLLTDSKYMEIWSHNVSPLIGPPEGAQYGEFKLQTSTYNETNSCVASLFNDYIVTPQNWTWVPSSGGPLTLNVMQSGRSLLMAGAVQGQAIGGVLTRITGLSCELLIQKIQSYLENAKPRKAIDVSVQNVCY